MSRDRIAKRLNEPVTVTFWVYGNKNTEKFSTAQEAINWVVMRENNGSQSTESYTFEDGEVIPDTVDIWQLEGE